MNAPSPFRSKRHGQPLLARLTAMCLLGLASTMVGGATQGPLVPYFDAVDVAGPPPTNFVLRVTSVTDGGPAAHAGLRDGDLIVALDGLRTRREKDWRLARYREQAGTPMRLDISRNGAWATVTVAHLLAGRKALFGIEEQSTAVVPRLLEWGVRIEPLPTHDEAYAPADGRGDAEPNASYGLCSRSWSVVNDAPGRVAEALVELATARRGGDREWVEELIRGWMLLMREEYEEAAQALRPLPERATHPFLDAFARFLSSVAREQGRWRDADDWKRCGVDADFLSACYPYPILPRFRREGFADPALQSAFDRMASVRSDQEYEALKPVADGFIRWNLPSAAENYVTHVTAAIVDGPRQGGWPFRSELIWEQRERREVLEALKARMDDKPDDRLLNAFAVLFPAAWETDLEALRTALETIHQAGTDYAAVANRILRHGGAYRSLDSGEWLGVWIDVDQKYHVPPAVYHYLAERTPILANRLSMGFCTQYGIMQDAATFASRNPWHIRKGLTEPEDGSTCDLLFTAVGDGTALSDAARVDAFERLCLALARVPDRNAYRSLAQLARHVPRDVAIRGLTRVAAGNREYEDIGAIRRIPMASAHWVPILEAADADAIATASAAAKRIAAGAPARGMCREVLPKAGTPAGMIILAAAAAQVGETGLSLELAVHAAGFHMESVESRVPATALWAVRDLSAAAGFLAYADPHLDACLKSKDRRAYLLAALHSLRKGDADAAAEYLSKARTAEAPVKMAPTTLVWDGERLPLAAFEARLDAALAEQRPATP